MGRPDEAEPVIGGRYEAELRAMKDLVYCRSEACGRQQYHADRTHAHPDILEFEKRFVKRMRTIGVPLFAHTICRSVADQNEAYIRGRSKARAGQSPHNYGLAVDIIHGIKAWDLTRKQWDILGHVGAEVAAAQGVKLEWGGNWQFWDPAHWELANWRELRASLKQV